MTIKDHEYYRMGQEAISQIAEGDFQAVERTLVRLGKIDGVQETGITDASIGSAFARAGLRDRAIDYLTRSTTNPGSLPLHDIEENRVHIAYLYAQMARFQEAADAFRETVDPPAWAYYFMGTAYAEHDALDCAVRNLESALRFANVRGLEARVTPPSMASADHSAEARGRQLSSTLDEWRTKLTTLKARHRELSRAAEEPFAPECAGG